MPILSQHHVARYQIGDRIGTTASSHLYRVQAIENGVPNVLKRLHPDNFTVEQAAHFRREYGILQSLDLPGVVKPIALVDDAEHPTMVLGNVFGEFLEDVLARRRLDLATCLEWACELASILAGLHAAHLVHQDLRPVNLMVTADQRICVLDLNMATADVPQTPTANHPLGGDWAYRSPEQTGRLNRKVDCRTDFYSLGITLYRMLTGRLPFHGNDALEWAHCHIARLPRPPDELCPDIPPMVSAIVLKLLAKMPEDRYQSTHGLLFDLHACQTQWEMRGAITPFAPGTHDVSERFQLSPKLVGREAEVEQLLASFQAMVATEHTALLLICGGAGIGKSALVHELRQPILRHGGYFISGKFDQYQREIPYATVTQAFHELVQQILAEDEGRIVVWSQQIQAAVGVNGRLIVDVLPQVELIIGPQNPVPELHPAEAQNRFHMVFQQFLGVFARQAHPLTLFLDDLQWADSASLRLLRELVISADKRFLLVVGAYRDNEVGPMHPLTLTLDSLRKDGVIFEQLFLSPLSLTDVARILENTFHCCPKRAEPLAQLLREKTAGNPFFTIQFLGALSEEGLLEFDAKAGEWIWDLKYIRAKDYTDNVVDLMLGKLRRLPDNTQQALKLLACLGSKAPFSRLMMVHGGSEEALHADLSDAVTGGLVLCEDGAYKFLHDRFQEAAYSLIPESKRASLHIEIGRQLYAQTPAGELIEKIFEVLDHLDRGATLLTSPKERKRVAELNLIAAKRAKGLAAYTSEQKYLAAGVALLEKDKWDRQYDLAFAFDLERAECEYLCGRFDNADALFQQTLAQARSQLDRARVMTAQMDLDQIAGRCSEGVTRGLNILSSFGMIFPKTDEAIAEETTAALDELARALAERSLDSQLDTPLLTDPEHRAIVRVLCAMLPLTYLSQPSLMPLMVLRMVKFCINHGNTEETCFGYLVYAMVLAGVYRDYAQAIEVSMFAIRLNEKFRDPRWKGPILHGHANHMLFWRQHFRHSVPVLEQAFAACIAAGDLNQASYLAFEAVWQAVERGEELDEVYRISERYAAFARQAKNEAVHQTIRIQQQFVRCLERVMN